MNQTTVRQRLHQFFSQPGVRREAAVFFAVMAAGALLCLFVMHNARFYDRTVVRVTAATETKDVLEQDMYGRGEQVYLQHLTATVENGSQRGSQIHLENKTSMSLATYETYAPGDELFVALDAGSRGRILGFKRDHYLVPLSVLFVLLVVLVGGRRKGLRSLGSLVVNGVIYAGLIALYLAGAPLIPVAVLASMLFIAVSVLIVAGRGRKTAATIAGTAAGTLFSVVLTVIVAHAVHSAGLHYEEMEFLTRPPEELFVAGLMIGTLGGIMDVAISVASAMSELITQQPDIPAAELRKAGMAIGQDIMGTMCNTMVFAYLSGTIPMIMLWMRNGYSTGYIISFNLSLEVIRALTSSIGIVASVPITLVISVFLLRGRAAQKAVKAV